MSMHTHSSSATTQSNRWVIRRRALPALLANSHVAARPICLSHREQSRDAPLQSSTPSFNDESDLLVRPTIDISDVIIRLSISTSGEINTLPTFGTASIAIQGDELHSTLPSSSSFGYLGTSPEGHTLSSSATGITSYWRSTMAVTSTESSSPTSLSSPDALMHNLDTSNGLSTLTIAVLVLVVVFIFALFTCLFRQIHCRLTMAPRNCDGRRRGTQPLWIQGSLSCIKTSFRNIF